MLHPIERGPQVHMAESKWCKSLSPLTSPRIPPCNALKGHLLAFFRPFSPPLSEPSRCCVLFLLGLMGEHPPPRMWCTLDPILVRCTNELCYVVVVCCVHVSSSDCDIGFLVVTWCYDNCFVSYCLVTSL